MQYITFKYNEKQSGGVILASFGKRIRKTIENVGNEHFTHNNEFDKEFKKYFLVFTSFDGKKRTVIEISDSDVICVTLNLVPEMVDCTTQKINDFFDRDINEKVSVSITNFHGYPFILENLRLFIDPRSRQDCLKIVYEFLPECKNLNFVED